MKPIREPSAAENNRSMPPGVIIPELAYPDVRQAVEWLCSTFGFKERLQIGDHRSQLIFGDGSIIVTKQSLTPGDSPAKAGDFSHSIMVRVADVDSHFEHARQSGARIVNPPTDYPYGERQYVVDDLGGHRWTFSQTIDDVDPGTWGGKLFE